MRSIWGYLTAGFNDTKDYIRVSGKGKALSFFLKRKNILSQVKDRIKWYLSPRFYYLVDFPTHLEVETAVSCQMRCTMCKREQMPTHLKHGIMDFDLYKKIIDEASRRGVYSIKLSWRGEPLLNSRIIEMIKYAKGSGIKDVAFLTNGERLNPELSIELIESGLDWISISVDGIGEVYNRIRWPETYDGIVEKIKFFKQYRDEKAYKKPLIRIQTIWSAVKNDPDSYFGFFENLADKVYIIADQHRFDLVSFPRVSKFRCPMPWQRMAIGYNGIVTKCVCDYNEYEVIGDVKRQSLYEIWHGDKLAKYRELIKSGKIYTMKSCATCNDTGEMRELETKILGKTVRLNLYIDQDIPVENIDSRPQENELKFYNEEKIKK